MSVIHVSRYGLARGTLSGKHVLALIWMIMTDTLPKMVSNWAVLTSIENESDQTEIFGFLVGASPIDLRFCLD